MFVAGCTETFGLRFVCGAAGVSVVVSGCAGIAKHLFKGTSLLKLGIVQQVGRVRIGTFLEVIPLV